VARVGLCSAVRVVIIGAVAGMFGELSAVVGGVAAAAGTVAGGVEAVV
jgi:hypothetical protein